MPPDRRPRLRARTGCRTCRKRHVKCDERRPVCANCSKKDRCCEYEFGEAPVPRALGALVVPRENDDVAAVSPLCTVADDNNAAIPTPRETPRESTVEAQPDLGSPPFLGNLDSILLQAPGPSYDPLLLSLPTLRVPTQIVLSPLELILFRNYVDKVSHWIDSFARHRPFHRMVPVMALRCPALLHSCLALASKQMVLAASQSAVPADEESAFRYYRRALKDIRSLLMSPECAASDEVLASCIILSTYEMLDVAGPSLGSHLKGLASLLQSRQIRGDDIGIKGAAYWTWYRHEIWAALQTGRSMSLDEQYWQPRPLASFEGLSVEEVANRILFVFGMCINLCSEDTDFQGVEDVRRRATTAELLEKALDDWWEKRPDSMTSFTEQDQSGVSSNSTIWFIYPQCAIAYQVYHASRILLALHRPPRSVSRTVQPCHGLRHPPVLKNTTFLVLRREIDSSCQQILATASAGIADAWSLVSVQCLYIAGLVIEGEAERRRTLVLIEECQERSGRKTMVIADDLRRIWYGC